VTTALELFPQERWTMPPAIAEADLYRYAFPWRWRPGPLRVYVGLNPSTMTALKTDHTGRKWKGFCDRDGFGGYIAINCFSFRATDQSELVTAGEDGVDLIGPLGDELFQAMLGHPHATEIMVCWGNSPDKRLTPRLDAIAALVTNPECHQHPVRCFGMTQQRQPRHPLMLSYATPLEAFRP
jgi:hypothetical protein